jgi:hypothetical protein
LIAAKTKIQPVAFRRGVHAAGALTASLVNKGSDKSRYARACH